jgi:hypothetical protein
MNAFYTFASANPWLTFFLLLIVCQTAIAFYTVSGKVVASLFSGQNSWSRGKKKKDPSDPPTT